jgi:hypothetical protein
VVIEKAILQPGQELLAPRGADVDARDATRKDQSIEVGWESVDPSPQLLMKLMSEPVFPLWDWVGLQLKINSYAVGLYP